MGWAMMHLLEADGQEAAVGDYKLWVAVENEQDVGVGGASKLVGDFFDLLERRGLLGSVSATKVSTDSQAILVVYLSVGVDWGKPAFHSILHVMRGYCGSLPVKVGWAALAASEILRVF